MGIHGARKIVLPPLRELQQVQFNIWQVAGKSMIAAVGVYSRAEDGSAVRTNIGADILDYRVFDLPSLGQVVWCLGDEIRQGWRELSSPKA